MSKLTVTLFDLMDIDQFPEEHIIQSYAVCNNEYMEFDDDKGTTLLVPLVMLGRTITLDNYVSKYESEITNVSLKVDTDNPKQLAMFKSIVKKVIKGKIDEVKFFELENHTLIFNERDQMFTCGCESFSADKAKELIAFLDECVNRPTRALVKKK